ncbi:unnamed protein product [Citrullus colocynthis]|uniref:Uncharacterized protein n=1 Tax=Citrullus colocynthis TaxID=252529 RepID=A0ABP0ZDB0_9ROSI
MFLDCSPAGAWLIDGKSIPEYLTFRRKGFVISARNFFGVVEDLDLEVKFSKKSAGLRLWRRSCFLLVLIGLGEEKKMKYDLLESTLSCQLCKEVHVVVAVVPYGMRYLDINFHWIQK